MSLAELTHVFGRLDPAHAGTLTVLDRIGEAIDAIPGHRLHAPDAAAWGWAGMLAGELARLNGGPRARGDERRWLNDALIATQAREHGAAVLTGNVGDFDFLSQLLPALRVVNYRRSDERP